MAHPASATLLVTHGNLMALLLKNFDDRIGFAEWQQLTNPDVYRISPQQSALRSPDPGIAWNVWHFAVATVDGRPSGSPLG
jgi:broad specificity phosphatase PhoE